ncbi:membrane-associated guanylate kinase, WW and PDZ domain-containing protein 1 isoform X4 [Rhinichthys klamathensis goyatoka]|uniref:membrane-associated guanylate kinase, WW and PDZ domain-containing protein 1 isoform X4 n=1 Tax=Rhinichthys klamathensis goyatoka TaxID=3034132 RepID=UPI0024B538C4|nr:membrane-associated guanylate kinase, WW and PDZ domain-containing protein 1 isoform X4 [Rhinichthys klamathensis goyatoka]
MYIDAFKRMIFERLNCLKRMCVCQRQCSSLAMSKVAGKKLHWRSKVQETFIPLVGGSGELGIAIGGGADYGEFPFVTAAPGGGITVGDIIIEIGGTPVLGLTLGDVRGLLNSCPHPIRIKSVSPGSTLCKDLRLYLSKCFTPGSMDSQLQQVIRENLYLRAVPCTTRQPRDGEITGVDYNFVSVEEFFSLEESGALLESGKFKGNYYGTPRPVHIGPESPPITYQEHRNLLRNFRTRSKSLSNLEKAGEEGDNSEEDSGLSGGSLGASSAPVPTSSPSQSRNSSGGDGSALENGLGPRRGARVTGSENWEMMYSDSGNAYYKDHHLKPSSWLNRRTHSRENVCMSELAEFTDQPGELRGFSVHTRLVKGPRGFGFNIVGGSRRREFLQIYSITPGGPSTLNTADILVYINDTCVLGFFHKEVVEILKAIPVGHTVDVVVRRGYPMLYNSDGCPKMPNSRLMASQDQSLHLPPPTTTQPQAQAPLPYAQLHLNHNGPMWSEFERGSSRNLRVRASRFSLDANGNSPPIASPQRPPSSYQYSNGYGSGFLRPPRTARSIRRLQSAELASQSDSEVVSAIGSHRASFIRNHNNNSLSTPPPLRLYSFKSSESDLSSSTPPPISRLPLPHTELSPGPVPYSPGGGRRYSHLRKPQNTLLTPPSSAHSDGPYFTFNGTASASSGSPNSIPSPGAMSAVIGSGVGGIAGSGELVPVALAKCERGSNMGFSVTAGGHGGRQTLVKKVWDHRQCNGLQSGDAIVKINGADVQSLSFAQVQRILQEHTKKGEVILLVYRGGTSHFSNSPNSVRRLTPPPPRSASDSEVPLIDSVPLSRSSLTPPSPALVRSSLVQSTSFLDSVPVTLTLEPRDWMSLEEGGTVLSPRLRTEQKEQPVLRGYEVELKRKPGEGFGFVIASQDVENVKAASLLPHRFVTVRRGSPAARSGQIRPGDRLEAVDGRSVVNLPHRELAQILRRAGNTLRLTIVPRASAHSSERADNDSDYKNRKTHRSKPKQDATRYYSVELERGSTGFGFSLRGGSEYNMGLYVLGLMEGGPASRSHKIQVSDQLVEINGDSTTGMTHSQAVEQIRTGGTRIHLVFKRGNGYVPDYDPDDVTAVSSSPQALQSGLASVTRRRAQQDAKSSVQKPGKTKRGRRVQREGDGGDRESPDSLEGGGRRSRDKRSQSLPRNTLRGHSEEHLEGSVERNGRKKEKGNERREDRSGRSKSEERVRRVERTSEGDESKNKQTINNQRLPEPKLQWEEDEEDDEWEREREREWTRERERLKDKEWEEEEEEERKSESDREWEREKERRANKEALEWELNKKTERGIPGELNGEQEISFHKRLRYLGVRVLPSDIQPRTLRPLSGLSSEGPAGDAEFNRTPFAFLTSGPSDYAESESGASVSECSMSAASISGLSVYLNNSKTTQRAPGPPLPGPWLKPSSKRIIREAERIRMLGKGRGTET